jgi:DsbC/DsbD-like thiol-disulfide interchange protein
MPIRPWKYGTVRLLLGSTACAFFGWVIPCLAQGQPPESPASKPPAIQPPGIRSPGEKSGEQLVRMQMSADVARIKPNEKFHLAFAFDLEPHWHIYWENAGASGAPTEIDVTAPPGFVVGKTLFPRPQTINAPEGICYGYENRAILLVEITAPPSAMPQVNFSAEASWLVCKDICKMGSAKSMLSLPFGGSDMPGAQTSAVNPDIAKFKSRLPKPLDSTSTSSIDFDGQTLMISIPGDGTPIAEFFPNPTPGVEFGEARFESHGGQLRTIVPVTLAPHNAMGKTMRLRGVVGRGRGLDDPCFAFDLPLADDGRPQRN